MTNFVSAGRLNKRVQFQRPSSTADDLGESDVTYTPYYSCWASIVPKNAPLLYASGELTSRPTVELTVRWTSSVTFQSQDQIVYSQASTGIVHTYVIQSFDNTEQADRELVILAEEINPKE